ncbi:MAG: hypothetical protein ACPGFC_04440 [Paracoccaceae bacterium]
MAIVLPGMWSGMLIDSLPLWAACGLCVIWAFVHIVIGGREVARPLRDSDLPALIKGTTLVVWHMVSAMLIAMALIFASAAVSGSADLAWTGTVLAGMLTVVGFVVPPTLNMRYRDLPQGWLFLPVALLGLVGT